MNLIAGTACRMSTSLVEDFCGVWTKCMGTNLNVPAVVVLSDSRTGSYIADYIWVFSGEQFPVFCAVVFVNASEQTVLKTRKTHSSVRRK